MSTKGENITLTFDIGLQKYLHKQLSNHRAGSIVVIDIVSGDILSMASVPTYDSNKIIKKPNYEYWQELLNNPLSPLTDRSIQGMYSPGSTFKMIVAIAALKHNIINSKNITIASKNAKGEAQTNRINVDVNVKIILAENNFVEKNFNKSSIYTVIDRKSEQKLIENKLIGNLSDEIAQQIIFEILKNTK